jgi:AcrR family transcriptional regulator
LPPGDTPKPGLRELKKARTRTEIQRQALRLFQRQGYAATTVEQIAAAAEVSPSTFFRYFPTKEDVVLWDGYDPRFMAALLVQPADRAPISALRGAMHTVFDQLTEEEIRLERERGRLINLEPELRARSLSATLESVQMLADALAERVGRDPGDFEVRNLVGAVFGAMFTAWLAMADDQDADIVATMDASLAHLEAGLPLGSRPD